MSLMKECVASTSSQHPHDTNAVTPAAKGKRKMCESEIPLPSTPPKSTPHLQLPSPETSTRYCPRLVQRMQADTCFRCRKQGHWMRDCPLNSPNPKSRGPTVESSNFPEIYCRCGHGFCEVKMAQNDRNYGRSYYACPIKRGKKCRDFVKWCDAVVDESDLRPPPYTYPTCACGAGVCRKEKESSGPNEGRYYFACPIRVDHGACNFRLWEDTLLGNPSIAPRQQGRQRTLHDYWDKEGNQSDEDNINDLGVDADSKRMRIACDSDYFSATKVPELLEEEDGVLMEASIERRDHTKFSSPPNHLDFPEFKAAEDLEDIAIINSVSWDAVEKKARSIIHRSTPSGIHSQQSEFQKRISTDANASFVADPCPMGWLGRLVFCHPKFPQPEPYICCVFPCFSSIIVPTQKIIHDGHSGESNHLLIGNPGQRLQLSTGYGTEVSGDAVSTNVSLNSERRPMSKQQRQKQIVLNALKDLLLELESWNPLDYESMRKTAEDTFDVLNTLPVDFKQFSEHVWEFINSISSLAKVQNSIQNDLSLEEHIQRYEEKKLRLADIHEKFVNTKTFLEVSQQHNQSLQEEASRLRAMLQGVEAQLTSSEIETKKMETELGDINASMMEAEESLKIAAAQVGTARKLCQERESKEIVAKTALEKAKLELEK